MNVTKNKLIEALNFLGEFPEKSLKKEELIKKLNQIYDKEIERLNVVINIQIYDLIKKLVESDENGIDIGIEYEPEVDFLENTLIIDELVIDEEKTHIKFNEKMKDRFAKFINKKNETYIKMNQTIVNLMINITEAYGIIEDHEMLKMINRFLKSEIEMEYIYFLTDFQIDLRNEITIVDSEDESYFMSDFVHSPEEIIYERLNSDLSYKNYTIEELQNNTPRTILERKEAQDVLNFFKKKKIEFAEEATMIIIIYIMTAPKFEIKEFMQLIKIDFDNLEDADEYLQLIMKLHNRIPHYSLYGYSPEELFKNRLEQEQKEKEKKKKTKIGRNDPCPCGSGKKYKNCCLNKVVHVDFKNEKYADCIDSDDSDIFFALRNLLLDYTNKQYNINKDLEDYEDVARSETDEVIEIRNKIWEDPNVIANYIKENPDNLDEKFISIIKEWNEKKVNDGFILYKYEEEYALLINDDNIYYVKGLKERLRDMIPEQNLPMYIKTVLLPYKNYIVYDSYIQQYKMSFGNGIRKIWDDNYKKMLKENKVKFEL